MPLPQHPAPTAQCVRPCRRIKDNIVYGPYVNVRSSRAFKSTRWNCLTFQCSDGIKDDLPGSVGSRRQCCAGCPLCATQEDRHLASEAARGSPSGLRDCSVLAEVLSDQHAAVFCPGAYTGAVPDMDIARSPTIEFARVLRSPLSRLQDDLNQAGPAVCHCAGELCREFLNRGCAARLDAHTRSKLDPIKFGIV